jgi:uncharacterized membrane protein
MGKGQTRRRRAPMRALIGPLVMLAGGMAVGAVVWRILMLDPGPRSRVGAAAEQLSQHDQAALDRLLDDRRGGR